MRVWKSALVNLSVFAFVDFLPGANFFLEGLFSSTVHEEASFGPIPTAGHYQRRRFVIYEQ